MIDHNIEEFRITLKDTAWITADGLVKILRTIVGPRANWRPVNFLIAARYLLDGQRWSPTPDMLKVDPRHSELAPLTNIVIVQREEPRAARCAQSAADWARLEAAANGDAAAAVEFCQGLLDHRYTYLFQASAS